MEPGESESDFFRRRAYELRGLSAKSPTQDTTGVAFTSESDLPADVVQELTEFATAFAQTMPELDQKGLFKFLDEWKISRKLQPGDHSPEIKWQE